MFSLNSCNILVLIYIFRWHNIKDEEIYDPIEKF